MGCKKIEAGPKPNPAKTLGKGPAVPSRFTGDYMKAKSNVKAYRTAHTPNASWGRNLPGVKFGKWQLVHEGKGICDYQRIGLEHDTGLRVFQEHTVKC
jgi:hypothetical protein